MTEDALPQAQAITDALRRAVDHKPGFSLAAGDYSLEVMTVALRCPDPPDQTCLSRIAQKIGAERYIWGSLRKEPKHKVAIHLSYWEKGSNQRDATSTYNAGFTDPSDDALTRIADDLVSRLLGAAEGRLVVRVGNLDGEVFVNDEAQGKLVGGRAQLTVPAGDVQVRVTASGYRDAEAVAQVPPGGSTEVELEAVPLARAESGEKERPAAPPSRGRTDFVPYAILATGAAVAVTGGVFWYLSSSQNQSQAYQDYRAQVPSGVDPCEAAKSDHRTDILDLCSQNQTNRVLAWVLMPVGLVIMGVGGWMLATAPSRPAHAGSTKTRSLARFIPSVGFGSNRASMKLELSF
jgi:hypothetical protein